VKPFRGKPVELKRANGEIHRSPPCARAARVYPRAPLRPSAGGRVRVGGRRGAARPPECVHFSLSITPRPVPPRSNAATRTSRPAMRGGAGARTALPRDGMQLISSGTRRPTPLRRLKDGGGLRTARDPRRLRCARSPRAATVAVRHCETALRCADATPSAVGLFWALTGPVLKHGPRSLACARVIGIIH
jgi:hypothetical protein